MAQNKDALQEANAAFQDDRFREALIYYNQLDKIEQSAPLLFKRGICHYEINQMDHALNDFRRAVEYGYDDPGIDYYTGLIEHQKGRFASAAQYYKKYLNTLKEDDVLKPKMYKLIKQCGRAIDLSYRAPIAIIEKLPKGINSSYDEVGLIESPTRPGRLYFTSNKPNTSLTMKASDYDVYYVDPTDDGLSDPKRMRHYINQSKEEILLGFSRLGDDVFFYRGEPHAGKIGWSRGTGGKNATVYPKINEEINLLSSDVYFYDQNVALFSKKGNDGYGGYDLYVSVKNGNKWGAPINLGPQVNSPFDELSPYLSDDGSTLYFSSDRDESIGGMDVFYSEYLYEADHWGDPQNMGIPINSPGDETHFALSSDGLVAYLASDRKSAVGGKDVFLARFKNQRATLRMAEELAFIDYQPVPLEELYHDTTQITNAGQTPRARPQNIDVNYQPIYYTSGIDLINPITEPQITEVIQVLQDVPELQLTLQCHATEEGITEYKLFSSIKIAERLASYMIDLGIPERRIQISGYADNYPLARPESQGGDYKLAEKYNSRIEFVFSNYDDKFVALNREGPELPSYARDTKFDLWQALVEGDITYKIQIAVVNQMYRGMALDLFNDAIVEKDPNTKLYNYTIGLYDNYADALQVKRDMDRLGITDATVVPYFDGRRLNEDQYSYFINEYPDLRVLMDYGE